MGPGFGLVLGSVLVSKWAPKWPQNLLKISSTMVQKSAIWGILFFLEDLELFR